MDLEFGVQCVLVSTSKIYNVGSDVNEAEITALVRSSFADGVRVTLPQVLKWAAISEEVRLFFSIFRMEGPEMISIKTLQQNEFIVYERHLQETIGNQEKEFPADVIKFEARHAAQLTLNRRALNFRGWLHTALQPLIAYRLESKTIQNYSRVPKDIKTKLEWVYGIRAADVRRCLQYTVGHDAAVSTGSLDKYEKQTRLINEEIVYFVASVVVLLNPSICQ